MHKAEVKAELEKMGLALADLDDEHELPPGTCSAALRKPHREGEQAIAKALGKAPKEIWSDRYNLDGTRKRPQPAANYKARPRRGHCQKGGAR